MADAINAGISRFAERGVGVEACWFGLDGSDDVEVVVADALCARSWECVVVGGGVRSAGDELQLFERVVNLVSQKTIVDAGAPVLDGRDDVAVEFDLPATQTCRTSSPPHDFKMSEGRDRRGGSSWRGAVWTGGRGRVGDVL